MKKHERFWVACVAWVAVVSVLLVVARLAGWGPFDRGEPNAVEDSFVAPNPGPRVEPPRAPDRAADEGRAGPSRDRTSVDVDGDRGESSAAAATTPEDGLPADDPPLPEGAVRVEVVRASDLEPVSGVPVSLGVSMEGDDARMPIRSDTTGPDGRVILDASGISFAGSPVDVEVDVACDLPSPVPVPVREPIVFPDAPDPVRIVVPDELLAALEPLRVVVVDAGGDPVAGIQVRFEAVRRNAPDDTDRLDGAETDATGFVEFERQEMFERRARGSALGVVFDFRVTAVFPAAEPPRASVPLVPDLDAGPIRIELPPTGRLHVHVHGADGRPMTEGASVGLSFRPLGAERSSATSYRRSFPVRSDGIARVGAVGLGLRLGVSAWVDGATVPPASEEIDGPTTPGQAIELTLQLGPGWPVVTGRMLGGDGEPLPAGTVVATRTRLERAEPRPQARVDRPKTGKLEVGEGSRFRMIVRRVPRAGDRQVVTFEHGGAAATIELPNPFPLGAEHEVGTLALGPLPILVAGRAVDESGRPMSGVTPRIARAVPGRRNHVNMSIDVEPTGDDGRFEVRYADGPDEISVWAHRRTKSGRTGLVPAGSTDVELVMSERDASRDDTGGTIDGRLLVDEGIALDHLGIVVELEGGSTRRQGVFLGGRFRQTRIPPGIVSVRVLTTPSDFEVARIDGVRVEEGRSSTDPRLAAIDLRGDLRYLRIRLVTPDGAPVGNRSVRLAAAGESAGSVRTDAQGNAAVLLPAGIERLALGAYGYETVEIGFADDGRDVVVPRREDG